MGILDSILHLGSKSEKREVPKEYKDLIGTIILKTPTEYPPKDKRWELYGSKINAIFQPFFEGSDKNPINVLTYSYDKSGKYLGAISFYCYNRRRDVWKRFCEHNPQLLENALKQNPSVPIIESIIFMMFEVRLKQEFKDMGIDISIENMILVNDLPDAKELTMMMAKQGKAPHSVVFRNLMDNSTTELVLEKKEKK